MKRVRDKDQQQEQRDSHHPDQFLFKSPSPPSSKKQLTNQTVTTPALSDKKEKHTKLEKLFDRVRFTKLFVYSAELHPLFHKKILELLKKSRVHPSTKPDVIRSKFTNSVFVGNEQLTLIRDDFEQIVSETFYSSDWRESVTNVRQIPPTIWCSLISNFLPNEICMIFPNLKGLGVFDLLIYPDNIQTTTTITSDSNFENDGENKKDLQKNAIGLMVYAITFEFYLSKMIQHIRLLTDEDSDDDHQDEEAEDRNPKKQFVETQPAPKRPKTTDFSSLIFKNILPPQPESIQSNLTQKRNFFERIEQQNTLASLAKRNKFVVEKKEITERNDRINVIATQTSTTHRKSSTENLFHNLSYVATTDDDVVTADNQIPIGMIMTTDEDSELFSGQQQRSREKSHMSDSSDNEFSTKKVETQQNRQLPKELLNVPSVVRSGDTKTTIQILEKTHVDNISLLKLYVCTQVLLKLYLRQNQENNRRSIFDQVRLFVDNMNPIAEFEKFQTETHVKDPAFATNVGSLELNYIEYLVMLQNRLATYLNNPNTMDYAITLAKGLEKHKNKRLRLNNQSSSESNNKVFKQDDERFQMIFHGLTSRCKIDIFGNVCEDERALLMFRRNQVPISTLKNTFQYYHSLHQHTDPNEAFKIAYTRKYVYISLKASDYDRISNGFVPQILQNNSLHKQTPLRQVELSIFHIPCRNFFVHNNLRNERFDWMMTIKFILGMFLKLDENFDNRFPRTEADSSVLFFSLLPKLLTRYRSEKEIWFRIVYRIQKEIQRTDENQKQQSAPTAIDQKKNLDIQEDCLLTALEAFGLVHGQHFMRYNTFLKLCNRMDGDSEFRDMVRNHFPVVRKALNWMIENRVIQKIPNENSVVDADYIEIPAYSHLFDPNSLRDSDRHDASNEIIPVHLFFYEMCAAPYFDPKLDDTTSVDESSFAIEIFESIRIHQATYFDDVVNRINSQSSQSAINRPLPTPLRKNTSQAKRRIDQFALHRKQLLQVYHESTLRMNHQLKSILEVTEEMKALYSLMRILEILSLYSIRISHQRQEQLDNNEETIMTTTSPQKYPTVRSLPTDVPNPCTLLADLGLIQPTLEEAFFTDFHNIVDLYEEKEWNEKKKRFDVSNSYPIKIDNILPVLTRAETFVESSFVVPNSSYLNQQLSQMTMNIIQKPLAFSIPDLIPTLMLYDLN